MGSVESCASFFCKARDDGSEMSDPSSGATMKTRHKSLDMQDPQCFVKKKQDMLTKAKNKFWNFSETLRQGKTANSEKEHAKSRTQTTLDYFFKHHSKAEKNVAGKPHALRKQNSVDSYPIKIEITNADDEENDGKISRTRPATICVGRVFSEAEALALERPRKKLSFREPEIMGYAIHVNSSNLPSKKHNKIPVGPEIRRSFSESDSMMRRGDSVEDLDLEVAFRMRVDALKGWFTLGLLVYVAEPGDESSANDRTVVRSVP